MDDFLSKLPKTDLHVHLDGSVRIKTLIELSKKKNLRLPSFTESGLMETVFKERYASLDEYLQGFGYTIAIMQDKETLEQVAYEFVQDNVAEGVRYVEVRFAPQFHINAALSMEDVLIAVNRGLQRGADEFNALPAVKTEAEPPFHYGIIVCAMRKFSQGFSPYFDNFLASHAFSERKRIYALAAMELAQAAVRIRNEYDLPIVGFDLAGPEAGYPAEDFTEAYHFAHKHFLKKTVHAGEAYGPESIFQAITDLYADRIGHGYYLFDKEMIRSRDIEDRERYVLDLAQFISDRRITLEICLTSNLQTNPNLKEIKHHIFGRMIKERLSTTICTDNRTVSRTSVSRELALARDHFGLSRAELRNIIIYGFKRSFFPGTYLKKRAYVRKVIDHYEAIDRKYHGPREGHASP